jgi:hypothetical protein
MINDSFGVSTVLSQTITSDVIGLYVNDSFSVETLMSQAVAERTQYESAWSPVVTVETVEVAADVLDGFNVLTQISQSVSGFMLDLNVLDSFGVETEIGQVISGRSVPSAYDQFGVVTVISQDVTETVGDKQIRWFKKCGISPQTIGSWFRQCP